MHKKSGEDRTCGSGDILVDRQTYSSQYFATACAGDIMTDNSISNSIYCSSAVTFADTGIGTREQRLSSQESGGG